MSERFYTNSALSVGPMLLQGPEAHHLATVCRFRPQDRIVLFNGDGHEYKSEVVAVTRKQIELLILNCERPDRELGYRLEVAAPLPKGDRADFLIEKLTELGATDFVPLHSERSVVHPRETKLDRLQRTVIEASKQCGRNVLMRIHSLIEWNQYCRLSELPARRLVAHAEEEEERLPAFDKQDTCLAIGPEGGFSAEEIDQARGSGWLTISLGARTLRLETAAIAMAAWAGLPR